MALAIGRCVAQSFSTRQRGRARGADVYDERRRQSATRLIDIVEAAVKSGIEIPKGACARERRTSPNSSICPPQVAPIP